VRAGRVQRRDQPRPPAGELPAQGCPVQAGQLAQGRVLPADAPRVPRTGAPLLAGEAPVVWLLLRWVGRRCTAVGAAAVHRAAGPTFLIGATPRASLHHRAEARCTGTHLGSRFTSYFWLVVAAALGKANWQHSRSLQHQYDSGGQNSHRVDNR